MAKFAAMANSAEKPLEVEFLGEFKSIFKTALDPDSPKSSWVLLEKSL
jgi:hypothetical protein